MFFFFGDINCHLYSKFILKKKIKKKEKKRENNYVVYPIENKKENFDNFI